MLSPIVSPPVTAASLDLPLFLPPPSWEAWAFRHRSPNTAPHPTLNQLLVL